MIGVRNAVRYVHRCGCICEESEQGYRLESQCRENHLLFDLCNEYPDMEYIIIQREMD